MENENELDFYGGGEGGEGPLRAADMVPLVEREAAPGDLAELLLELQHDPIWTFEVTLHSGEAARYLPGGMDVAHLRGRIEAAGLALVCADASARELAGARATHGRHA